MNDKLSQWKRDYEKVPVPEGFEERMKLRIQEGKRLKRKQRMKSAMAAAVLVAAGTVGALNASPAFAETVSEIPGLAGVVRVLTFHRYEVSEHGMEATVVTPKIEGLLNPELEQKLNEEFEENAKQVIAEFEAEVKSLSEAFPGEDVHMGVNSGFLIKTDTEQYLALDLYLENIAGSSSTVHKFFTIDKKSGALVTLPALFSENADYVKPISEYLKEEMKRQNEAGENVYWIDSEFPENDFQEIEKDQNFYLNAEGQLVICFDKYVVGPGSSGSPEFVIPNDVIADILKK